MEQQHTRQSGAVSVSNGTTTHDSLEKKIIRGAISDRSSGAL